MATAADYFLKIEGIEGESADSKHANEIQLESWSFSERQAADFAEGKGGGAGKVRMQDFHFTMKVNKASPKLFLACAQGEHIAKATLTCRKAGKDQQEFLKVTLSNVLVSSYQSGGDANDIVPIDKVALTFAKIETEYKPQNEKGALGAAVKAGYDVTTQKKV